MFANKTRNAARCFKRLAQARQFASHNKKQQQYYFFAAAATTATLAYVAAHHFSHLENVENVQLFAHAEEKVSATPGQIRQGLPEFTRHEIAQHKSKEQRVWVTFKHGVYDVTEFIAEHPGGDKILLAAGNDYFE